MKTFDVKDIFFFFLKNNINTYYRGVIAMTLFLSPLIMKTFLVVLVFFASLALIDRRLLGLLSTKYINRGDISGFHLSGVLILLFCRSIPLKTLDVNFLDT